MRISEDQKDKNTLNSTFFGNFNETGDSFKNPQSKEFLPNIQDKRTTYAANGCNNGPFSVRANQLNKTLENFKDDDKYSNDLQT